MDFFPSFYSYDPFPSLIRYWRQSCFWSRSGCPSRLRSYRKILYGSKFCSSVQKYGGCNLRSTGFFSVVENSTLLKVSVDFRFWQTNVVRVGELLILKFITYPYTRCKVVSGGKLRWRNIFKTSVESILRPRRLRVTLNNSKSPYFM